VPDQWARDPAIERLATTSDSAEAYLVLLDPETQRFETRRLDPIRVRVAAETLRHALRENATPPFKAHWTAFINAVR